MATPTLHELFVFDRVKAISFWCTNHTCGRIDDEDKGMVAIDYGPSLTLPEVEKQCHCMTCGAGTMQVRPCWGIGGDFFLQRSGRGMADTAAKLNPA